MLKLAYPGIDIPELTDSQIKAIFLDREAQLNDAMLAALTHGFYTGVVVVTLWAIASRENRHDSRSPRFLVFVILLLYLLATLNLYHGWAQEISNYFIITNGKNIPITLTMGIDAILSTILADATLIWRCWIVWGRSWYVVLVPIICTILATISRGFVAYYTAFGPTASSPPQALYLENIVNWAILNSSLVLATLLWCTFFIIFRILRVGGVAAGMRVYHRVVEMLVESASLYSAVIVILLVFQVRNEVAGTYIQELGVAMRGIAPTILVGRVAAGHARPDDSWSESSVASSLQFQNHSSSQTDSQMSIESGGDTPSPRIIPDLEQGLGNRAESGLNGTTQSYDDDLPTNKSYVFSITALVQAD
ncbi:hypothetical protein EV421DRAFT_2041508 [Armillaria borealis]|uniref:Uncharacterized protein n=1 Tax=Armillaria borealis TaxID=47425 RepID=A0AA39IWI8_9AGAR|nr:hypothetical protein EV421DRAFT_2041508 [Armillaria borealis]